MSPSPQTSETVRHRLRTLARERGDDVHSVMLRYTMERLLYHLSCSDQTSGFVLKGAMLFALWTDALGHRPTRDIDLLGYGDPAPDTLAATFRAVCLHPVEIDDGLNFDPDTVQAVPIRADAVYDGVRVTLTARLGKARLKVQVDIGFGDAVTPGPVLVHYPTLLGHPPPTLRAYPPVTAVAEKLEAMVSLGVANSRRV